jgi:hypothetical protein
MTAARRRAAMLAVDVVGNPRFTREDEEGSPRGCVRRREAQPVR